MQDLPYQALAKAVAALKSARYLVALTGAGISVESGIAPFRGPGGLWTKYGEPSAQDYQRFLADPKAWWEARLEDERSNRRPEFKAYDAAEPNPAHHALAALETHGVLQHLITQNVDGLHHRAGSQALTEIHGNRYKLRCLECGARFPRQELAVVELPPRCPACTGILKLDTVMFGEPIPDDALVRCREEAARADCMLVVGTSALVRPAAELPLIAKHYGACLIEVNPEDSALTSSCDVALRGAAGRVLPQLLGLITGTLE